MIMQDPCVMRLPCNHKGTYADDCLVDRVKQHRCYMVATCDRDLRRRIRKVRTRVIDCLVSAISIHL
jgi:U3 small nucleolar RNA-associated protein 24